MLISELNNVFSITLHKTNIKLIRKVIILKDALYRNCSNQLTSCYDKYSAKITYTVIYIH